MRTAIDTGVIMILVGATAVLTWVLARSRLPQQLVALLGVDLVHFGVILVVNLQIGVLTPPVAASAFVTARIAGITLEKQIVALLPFIAAGIVALVIITYIPWLSLFIPGIFG
jgi:C4-dicarboxylate transporter DctM subunit